MTRLDLGTLFHWVLYLCCDLPGISSSSLLESYLLLPMQALETQTSARKLLHKGAHPYSLTQLSLCQLTQQHLLFLLVSQTYVGFMESEAFKMSLCKFETFQFRERTHFQLLTHRILCVIKTVITNLINLEIQW